MKANGQITFQSKAPLDKAARAAWLADFADKLRIRFKNKYECGQREHEGDLGDVPVLTLLDEIWCEQLDQISYVAELKRRIVNGDDIVISRQLLTHLYGLAHSVKGHRHLTRMDEEHLQLVKNLLFQITPKT